MEISKTCNWRATPQGLIAKVIAPIVYCFPLGTIAEILGGDENFLRANAPKCSDIPGCIYAILGILDSTGIRSDLWVLKACD